MFASKLSRFNRKNVLFLNGKMILLNFQWTSDEPAMNHDEPAMNQRWTSDEPVMNQFLIFSGIFAEKWNILRNCSWRWQMKMKVWNRSWKNFFLAMPQKFDEPVMNQQWTSDEPAINQRWTSDEPAMNQVREISLKAGPFGADFASKPLNMTKGCDQASNSWRKLLQSKRREIRWTSDEPAMNHDEPVMN